MSEKNKSLNIVYVGQAAKNILDSLDNFFEKSKPLIKLPLPIVGMFREEPREWVCYLLYLKENEYWLEISSNLLHRGECVKLLNSRLESEGYNLIPKDGK